MLNNFKCCPICGKDFLYTKVIQFCSINDTIAGTIHYISSPEYWEEVVYSTYCILFGVNSIIISYYATDSRQAYSETLLNINVNIADLDTEDKCRIIVENYKMIG